MVKIRKYANFIERFLQGPKGQRFFNFAYSIGAAIVIWGALFKILHLPGGNTLLCIGMGTEIAMFILTAFDRPPKEYNWEEVFPVLESKDPEDRPDFASAQGIVINGASGSASAASMDGAAPADATPSGITVHAMPDASASSPSEMEALRMNIQAVADQMEQLHQTTKALNEVSAVLLQSYQAITDNSDLITRSSTGYADQMADLNRNLGGLNTIYEIQLKNVSGQIEAIDRVNRGLKDIRDMYEKAASDSSRYCEETEKMARYMKQINAVYEKMITALTISAVNPMMGNPASSFPGSADE